MRGHRPTNGLDAILDIEVKKLSALGRFVLLLFESHQARKTTTHYQFVDSKSSHVCPPCNGCFSLKDQTTVETFLCTCSKYPQKLSNSIARVIRFV